MSQELVFAENLIKCSRKTLLYIKAFVRLDTLYASKLSNVLSLFDINERQIPQEQLTGHVTKLFFYIFRF